MKRLNNNEKQQVGHLVHYYRMLLFHSEATNSADYKQINFCDGVCSQAQLSRLEHGDALKDQEIYAKLLNKLNLKLNKVTNQDIMIFETYFSNILTYQNDDALIINYNEYVLIINKYQNIFKENIIYTHYNYALEFILSMINHDIEDASYLIEDIESNLDILPPKFLILTLQYLGEYYHLTNNYNKANKFYLIAIEHMHKFTINNPIIYIDIAYNYLKMKQSLPALDYLKKAHQQFLGTDNNEILTRIHACFGLIYLKNRYYDNGLNFLSHALEYAEKVIKKDLVVPIYELLSVGLYLRGLNDRAIEMIKNALQINKSERSKVILAILSFKINQEEIKLRLKNDDYKKIVTLFKEDEQEEWFEDEILPSLDKLPDVLHLLVLNEMISLYKQNKKYKKALDLIENHII